MDSWLLFQQIFFYTRHCERSEAIPTLTMRLLRRAKPSSQWRKC